MARTRTATRTTPEPTETPVGRDLLLALHAALGALLNAAPSTAAEPAPEADGLGDDGMDGLGGGDDGLDGLGDEPAATTVEQVRDELKKVLKKLGDKPGRAKITAILQKFGATDIPSLDDDKYDAVIALAKKFQ